MTTQSTTTRLRALVIAVTMAIVAALALAITPGTASAEQKFSCEVDGQGNLSWADNGASKYWVYRSVNGAKFEWLGRTLGSTSFSDAGAPGGAEYQVHYQGISRTDCSGAVDTASPAPAPAPAPAQTTSFDCAVNGRSISWDNHGASKYWVYRSVDGGNSYNWLGRTLGDTKFVDNTAPAGAVYQVHYQGLPREDCTGTNIGAPAPAPTVAPAPTPAPAAPVAPVANNGGFNFGGLLDLFGGFDLGSVSNNGQPGQPGQSVVIDKAPVVAAPVAAPVVDKGGFDFGGLFGGFDYSNFGNVSNNGQAGQPGQSISVVTPAAPVYQAPAVDYGYVYDYKAPVDYGYSYAAPSYDYGYKDYSYAAPSYDYGYNGGW